MAISSAGIGSGLDVQSLVSQLVASERSPAETRLSRQESSTRSTLSALSIFKSTMAGLQTSVNALKGGASALDKLSVSSSKPELFTATTSSGAAAGSFGVEVLSLATVSKINSDVYGSADAVVGNGTVTISVGAESFDITLDNDGNSLADLRDKINQASDNTGVTASLLNVDGGTRLVLTARETGTANALSLSSSAEIGGAAFINTAVLQTAVDAEIEIDGFTYISGSNTVTAAVDGVSFNLLKAEPGTVGTLNLNVDSKSSSEAVQALVKSYNTIVAVLATYGKYDASSKTAGPLMGDASVRGALSQIRGILSGSSTSGGDFQVLSQLGITTQADGTLKVDSAKLDAAIASDAQGVKSLFSGSDGFATQLSEVLSGVLGTGGRLEAGTQGLQSRLDNLADQRDRLDLRMAAVERRYRQQFTALDTLLGQLQTTSSYLTQQLSNLPGSNSN
ncbi:MAG: flagellar filament capping protein FliD [Panacagrimonas sp.]